MTPRSHLESIDPGLVGDWLERAAIRIDSGQSVKDAHRKAYEETCRRKGVEPQPKKNEPR